MDQRHLFKVENMPICLSLPVQAVMIRVKHCLVNVDARILLKDPCMFPDHPCSYRVLKLN